MDIDQSETHERVCPYQNSVSLETGSTRSKKEKCR